MPVGPGAQPDVLRAEPAALVQAEGAPKDDAVDATEEEVPSPLTAPPAAPIAAVPAGEGVGEALVPCALGGRAA